MSRLRTWFAFLSFSRRLIRLWWIAVFLAAWLPQADAMVLPLYTSGGDLAAVLSPALPTTKTETWIRVYVYESENPYNGVFCYVQSPTGLAPTILRYAESPLPTDAPGRANAVAPDAPYRLKNYNVPEGQTYYMSQMSEEALRQNDAIAAIPVLGMFFAPVVIAGAPELFALGSGLTLKAFVTAESSRLAGWGLTAFAGYNLYALATSPAYREATISMGPEAATASLYYSGKAVYQAGSAAVLKGKNALCNVLVLHNSLEGVRVPLGDSRLVTVLGSGRAVNKYRGLPGFNVFDVRDVPQSEWDRLNSLWLNSALRRGDEIWLLTDPAKHQMLMDRLGKQSAYLEIEIPMLKGFDAVTIPKHAAPAPTP